jgi:hypothetical protein
MTTPLPPTDPSTADDKLPGEAALAALYRQLPQSAPSPELDAAVLRAAARALEGADDEARVERRKGPREPGDWVHPKPVSDSNVEQLRSIESAARARRRRTPSWLIALGSAASLVLVAGLAWHMRGSSPPQSAPVAHEEATAARTPAAADQASPAVVPLAAPLTPTVLPEPVARSAPPSADRQIVMQVSAAKKLKQNDALQFARRKAAARSVVAPPPVAELAAAPSAAPPPSAPPAPPQEVSANAVSGVADQVAVAPSAAKPMPAAASVATDGAARDNGTAQQPGDTPAQELDKIRRLFDQGQRDQALPRLRAFRQAHPQWPLPPALQAQLQEQ